MWLFSLYFLNHHLTREEQHPAAGGAGGGSSAWSQAGEWGDLSAALACGECHLAQPDTHCLMTEGQGLAGTVFSGCNKCLHQLDKWPLSRTCWHGYLATSLASAAFTALGFHSNRGLQRTAVTPRAEQRGEGGDKMGKGTWEPQETPQVPCGRKVPLTVQLPPCLSSKK